jgi:hypothetical protein
MHDAVSVCDTYSSYTEVTEIRPMDGVDDSAPYPSSLVLSITFNS